MSKFLVRWACPALVVLITACQSTSPPVAANDLAEEVRSAATVEDGVIDVFPVTDPAAEELISQARWLESNGRPEAAAEHVERALNISPRDPKYWQYLAELDLKRERFEQAVANAERSIDLGPRLGELCIRNWLTLSRAHAAMGQVDRAADAEQRADGCTVRQRARF